MNVHVALSHSHRNFTLVPIKTSQTEVVYALQIQIIIVQVKRNVFLKLFRVEDYVCVSGKNVSIHTNLKKTVSNYSYSNF